MAEDAGVIAVDHTGFSVASLEERAGSGNLHS